MGIPLHFVAHGEGTPLLALHGWTPDHRLMTGCLEPIFAERPGYRRVYPDLPGMGRTPAPASVASADDIVDALLGFVEEQFGGEPFLLAGESYGGYLARAIVHARPRQVLGLLLICPPGIELDRDKRNVPPRTVLREDPELVAGLSAEEAAHFTEGTVVQSPETLRRFREDIGSGIALADEKAMERIQENWTLRVDPESGPAYERPTLVLTGRQDWAVGYAEQYSLLAHYPRATFVVLDRAGHNLQIEQPTLFGALVLEWLDRVGDSRAESMGERSAPWR